MDIQNSSTAAVIWCRVCGFPLAANSIGGDTCTGCSTMGARLRTMSDNAVVALIGSERLARIIAGYLDTHIEQISKGGK